MARKAQKNFEDAILELENIVNHLEEGNVSLDDSIKQYKNGMDLAKFCIDRLKKAEQEIYVYEDGDYKKLKEGKNDEWYIAKI